MQLNHQKKTDKEYRDGSAQRQIHIKPSKEGSLHKAMGVPQGKKIGRAAEESKMAIAKKNHEVPLERKVLFALNFGHKK